MTRKGVSWMVVCLVLGLGVATAFGEAAPYVQQIGDKEYRITPGTKAGTWQVTFGEESFLWEPQPWQPENLQKEGPKFYDIWIADGLPDPWDVPFQKRLEVSGEDLQRKAYTEVYFPGYLQNFCTEFTAILISPEGIDRRRSGQECIAMYTTDDAKGRLPGGERDDVRHKWYFYWIEPRNVLNVGVFARSYHDPNKDDAIYLYSPAVRKVRRLAAASRQDYIPGFLFRYEDLVYTKPWPNFEYTNTGKTRLWTGKSPDGRVPFGIGYDDKYMFTIRIDGLGEPVVLMEVKPKISGYWFDRIERWVGLKTFRVYYETAWDSKGQLLRERVNALVQVPNEPPHHVFWGAEYIFEPGSAYRMVDAYRTIYHNVDDFPWNQMNAELLAREPKKLFWWR